MEYLILISSVVYAVLVYGTLLVLQKLQARSERVIDKLLHQNNELNDRLMAMSGRPYMPTFNAPAEEAEEGEGEEEDIWHSIG